MKDVDVKRLLALHKKACECEAAWWVFRGDGQSVQGRRLADEAKAADKAFVDALTESIGPAETPAHAAQMRDVLMMAGIALRQLSQRAEKVKAELDAGIPEGDSVHEQSAALTWPISTAKLAIDKIDALLAPAAGSQS